MDELPIKSFQPKPETNVAIRRQQLEQQSDTQRLESLINSKKSATKPESVIFQNPNNVEKIAQNFNSGFKASWQSANVIGRGSLVRFVGKAIITQNGRTIEYFNRSFAIWGIGGLVVFGDGVIVYPDSGQSYIFNNLSRYELSILQGYINDQTTQYEFSVRSGYGHYGYRVNKNYRAVQEVVGWIFRSRNDFGSVYDRSRSLNPNLNLEFNPNPNYRGGQPSGGDSSGGR